VERRLGELGGQATSLIDARHRQLSGGDDGFRPNSAATVETGRASSPN
jgi:hypothetical protein